MLTLTEKAVQKVREVISAQPESDSFLGIRVAVTGGGCSGFQYSMNLERQSREDDRVIQVDGFQVLVDEQSLLYLDGTEIDYIEGAHGAGFQFQNPNVKSTCGCGESFQA